MKKCSNCEIVKPKTDFYRNRTHATGVRNICKLCQNTKRTENRRKNPVAASNAVRRSKLKCKYGISVEQYDLMFQEQNGVCAICGRESPDGRRLHIDHCHATNTVRGLLCCDCNRGLGIFKDNLNYLQKAFDYLQKWS